MAIEGVAGGIIGVWRRGFAYSSLVKINHRVILLEDRATKVLHPCAARARASMEVKARLPLPFNMDIEIDVVGCMDIESAVDWLCEQRRH